jgi:hypothetical protein
VDEARAADVAQPEAQGLLAAAEAVEAQVRVAALALEAAWFARRASPRPRNSRWRRKRPTERPLFSKQRQRRPRLVAAAAAALKMVRRRHPAVRNLRACNLGGSVIITQRMINIRLCQN